MIERERIINDFKLAYNVLYVSTMMILINYDDIDYDYDCNWSVGQGQKFFLDGLGSKF